MKITVIKKAELTKTARISCPFVIEAAGGWDKAK
jgi:hypothetical protein